MSGAYQICGEAAAKDNECETPAQRVSAVDSTAKSLALTSPPRAGKDQRGSYWSSSNTFTFRTDGGRCSRLSLRIRVVFQLLCSLSGLSAMKASRIWRAHPT